jgi:hypothetical protein
MNTTNIGVWLLELVTSPDRASAIVGDFAEESAAHDRFWLWRQIAQTLVAHIAREFTSARPGLIGKCILRSFAYPYVAVATGTMIASPLWYGIVAKFAPQPTDIRASALPIFVALLAASPFFVRAGWLLAEKTNRPIAATSIFSIVCFFLARNPNDAAHPYAPWISLLVLIGAIWQRRRSLRTA